MRVTGQDAWHKDDSAEMDSTARREGAAGCGQSAEIPERKQEITSAAMQQLCQGARGRRKEGAEQRGGGSTSTSSTLLFSA